MERACDNGTRVYLRVGLNWVPCPPEGGEKKGLPGFSGGIICPPVGILCAPGFTSSNFNADVVDPSKNNQSDYDWLIALGQVPFWAWIIIGVTLLFIIISATITLICCIAKYKKQQKWQVKNTVDVTKVDIEH